jgi:two-component system, NarL family, response regulator LiaR
VGVAQELHKVTRGRLRHEPFPETSMIRVLVADDHDVVRRGLDLLIGTEPDLECVGLARDGLEAVTLAQELLPDVVVMEVVMPRLDGIAAARELQYSQPQIKVLALTCLTDKLTCESAIEAGITGYLSKQTRACDIAAAIRAVARGAVPVGSLIPVPVPSV